MPEPAPKLSAGKNDYKRGKATIAIKSSVESSVPIKTTHLLPVVPVPLVSGNLSADNSKTFNSATSPHWGWG